MAKKMTLNFEEALARLEEIVSTLERGDAPLEESLRLFEEGSGLMKQCTELLNKAEQKVRKLTVTAEGELVEVPFEGEN